MKLPLQCFSAVGALSLFAFAPSSSAQEPHLQTGASFFRQGDYSDALKEFRQAQVERPLDASIQNLLGITETKLGRIDEANAYYRNAIETDPALLAPHKNLAVNYLTAARYEDAEEQLKIGLKLNATDPFLHYYLASLYAATSRDREAVEQFDVAASLIGNDPALLTAIALACIRLDMREKALALVSNGERRSLLNISQEYQLALLLTSKKMYQDATQRFRQIVQAQPDSWSARVDLAISLLNSDERQEALAILKKLAQERVTDANVQALLGSAYELSGDDRSALAAYRVAVVDDPGNPDRYLDYARLLMDLDRYSEAASIVQAGIGNVSESYALNIRKGSIQMLEGRYAEARATFQGAIEAHPEISLGYYAFAQSFMREGRDREAASVLGKAETNAPPDAKIEYLHGIALARLGMRDEAIYAFEKSIALDGHVAEPHYELGKLLLDAGRIQPAKKEFEQVVAIAPEHANAFYQLSRVYVKLGDKAEAARMAEQTQQLLAKQRASAFQEQKLRLRGFEDVNQ